MVGISWLGGGTSQRRKEKSLPFGHLVEILQDIPNTKFINLQYGDCDDTIKKLIKLGIDIVNDSQINPLQNMDAWLAQVAACDAVVSVANTTIHGSGGLAIPTMCLLSIHSDWRWFSDVSVDRNYWYPSVGIARQEIDGSWSSAVLKTRRWLQSGLPTQFHDCLHN